MGSIQGCPRGEEDTSHAVLVAEKGLPERLFNRGHGGKTAPGPPFFGTCSSLSSQGSGLSQEREEKQCPWSWK